ncbi:ABC transporter ATP-binding protein [Dinoroseobacter sp. S76]|uniref:ABC transporter ATP-binding protein n=1 Tax=Dinoroseobacter sp. S76 TaxID=3415124 RepID=UPI003C7AC866
MLSLSNLNKAYGAVVIAEDLSLEVPRGQALGILGPNGAGKTSLFNLIVGTVPVDGGRMTLEGAEITAMPAADRCHLGIARSYQVPHPFVGMTVYENCLTAACFGGGLREAEAATHCVEVLQLCGLAVKGDSLAGDLTLLERKRLELARALASRPKLLLLDEIAGGLTEPECDALVETIRTIRATGVTIVWIEHVLHALTEVADRAILLSGGHILADATPGEIMDDPVVREIYMGAPADAA